MAAGSGAASSMEAKRREVNMRTLQRHDPSITEIVDSASYVVLYRYEAKAGGAVDETGEPEMAWVKTGMEGSMFLFRRSKLPRYGFFILNRHSTENFLEDLIDEESLELTPEYIIVQGADERIHGIWVFEEEHRERIAQRMMELCRSSSDVAPGGSSVPLQAPVASVTSQTAQASTSAQSISLDMLFGSTSSSVKQPAPADSSSSTAQAEHPRGQALLDTLFASVPSNTSQISPVVSERMPPPAAQVSAQSDEDALRNLLGLSSTIAPRELERRQTPPHLAGLPQAFTNQAYNRNFEPPHIAPVPQRMHQIPDYDSPELERRMLPQQPPVPHQPLPSMAMGYGPPHGGPMYSQPPQPSQQFQQNFSPPQPPPPSFSQRQPQYPAPSAAQRPVPTSQQQSLPANFNSAPLMPSVILNKNRSASSATKSPSAALSPAQRSQNGLPSPVASYAQLARAGAQSIPPPPVPPVESRPAESQALAQSTSQDSFDKALASPPQSVTVPLTANVAMDALNETLKRSHLYQKKDSYASTPVDRQTFRSQLVGLLQDAKFVEALYQQYVGYIEGQDSTGSLI